MASFAGEGDEKEDTQGNGDGDEQHKHTVMLGRLSALDVARRKQLAARRAEHAAESNPLESVQAFHAKFVELRESVERQLKKARSLGQEADRIKIKGELEAVSAEVKEMEKTLADSCYFLAAYDVQTSQATIAKVKEEISVAMSELLPKKFSFKNKIRGNHNADKKKEPSLIEDSNPNPVLQERCNSNGAGFDFFNPVNNEEMHRRLVIRDMNHTSVVKDRKVLAEREVVISNLCCCKVFLKGSITALYIHKIKDCQICVGPVMGSVLLEEVEGSVLMLASHQIRIHSTTESDFYLRVRSRPIVEYTRAVRFAPYAFRYGGLEDELAAASLAEETGMWEKVDDFRWLRAVPSPNWSILPADERSFVDASDPISDDGLRSC